MPTSVKKRYQCSAITGHTPANFGMVAIRCRQRVGIRSFETTTGIRVAYCAIPSHEANVRRRFAEVEPDPIDVASASADRRESWTLA
jgi:hypothetical protein